MTSKKRNRNRRQPAATGQKQLRFFGIAAAVVAFILLGLAISRPADDNGQNVDELSIAPEVGAIAPDFELTSFAGEQTRLTDFRGRPVAIMFMHTW